MVIDENVAPPNPNIISEVATTESAMGTQKDTEQTYEAGAAGLSDNLLTTTKRDRDDEFDQRQQQQPQQHLQFSLEEQLRAQHLLRQYEESRAAEVPKNMVEATSAPSPHNPQPPQNDGQTANTMEQ